MASETQVSSRESLIVRLREVADFFEQHPEVSVEEDNFGAIFLNIRKDAVNKLATFAKAAGRVEKDTDKWHFSLRKSYGDINLIYRSPREEVCTPTTVKKVIPARHFEAFDVPERVETETTYDCPPSLLELAAQAGAE